MFALLTIARPEEGGWCPAPFAKEIISAGGVEGTSQDIKWLDQPPPWAEL